MRNKKYPSLAAEYIKNEKGEIRKIYLPIALYESIFEEINDLKENIKKYKENTKNR